MDMITLSMAKAYTDEQRLAYTERGTVRVIDTAVFLSSDTEIQTGTFFSSFVPELGVTYLVNYDGKDYVTQAKFQAVANHILGNAHLYDDFAEDTGEPFLLRFASEGDWPEVEVYATGGNFIVHVDVYAEQDIVYPIDPKFIVLTSPSGKKFNLSVDDSGTISATEVV